MMKITATAAIPYAVVVSTPPVPGAVTVVTEVVPPGPETVTLVGTVLVAAAGTFWRVSATMSPGTPVPHETRPAVIGKMISIWPLAVAPMEGRALGAPRRKRDWVRQP